MKSAAGGAVEATGNATSWQAALVRLALLLLLIGGVLMVWLAAAAAAAACAAWFVAHVRAGQAQMVHICI